MKRLNLSVRGILFLSASVMSLSAFAYSAPKTAPISSIPKIYNSGAGESGNCPLAGCTTYSGPQGINAGESTLTGDTGSAAVINLPSNDATTATTNVSTQAVKAAEAASKDCVESKHVAIDACENGQSTSGMSDFERFQMGQMLNQVAQTTSQALGAKGSAQACQLTNVLNVALQGMTLLKSNSCGKTRSACAKVCDEAATRLKQASPSETAEIERMEKSGAVCKALKKNQMMMAMQMAALGQSALGALQCKNGTSTAPTANAAFAGPTPVSLTTAVGDCSDSKFASTSTYCICKSNPADALCARNVANGGGTVGSGVAGGGIATPGISDGASDDMAAIDQSAIASKGEKGANAGGSGGGGGGIGGGSGGGGALGGGEGGGDPGSGFDKNVITGASSGGGGIAGLSAGGGGGGGGQNKSAGGSGDGSGGFNLSKYLPKGMFKNRGLAGMSVPSTDGVTGPLGPSIWEKVHNRYEEKKSTLILDK